MILEEALRISEVEKKLGGNGESKIYGAKRRHHTVNMLSSGKGMLLMSSHLDFLIFDRKTLKPVSTALQGSYEEKLVEILKENDWVPL